MIEGKEKKFKKGQIILKEKSFELAIYDVMLGRVGVYINYGTPEEKLVVEIEAGDFLNVISFLETRPRNTTAVALEPTVVKIINHDNFQHLLPGESGEDHESFGAYVRPDARSAASLCAGLPSPGEIRRYGQDKRG